MDIRPRPASLSLELRDVGALRRQPVATASGEDHIEKNVEYATILS
jgi:hypothetical protein